MNRRREEYTKKVSPALKKEFSYTNIMAIPKITKIVVNMGLGEATQNAKIIDTGADELGLITGRKATIRRATKSIAQFKLRQGLPVGVTVTLRGEVMYEFLDRLISIALPRVRDFRGISPKGFDGCGNYTLGLQDQLIFPEIDYMKVDKNRGMNVSVVTTAKTDEEGRLKSKIDSVKIDSFATYELVFETGPYWIDRGFKQIMDQVVLRFKIPDPSSDYHMPIIISPNSYSVWWSK